MPVALPALIDFAVLLVALGIILVALLLTKALFGVTNTVIGWIPGVSSWAKGPLHKIEQKLISKMSEAATGVEAAVAWSWHVLASTTAQLAHEIAHVASAGERIAWYVTTRYPVKVLHAIGKRVGGETIVIRKTVTVIQRAARATARELSHPESGVIAEGVKIGTRAIAAELAAAERWINTRGRWLNREITVDIPHDLAHLRERDLSLGRGYEYLRDLLRRHERLLGAGALTAATAFALSKLGGWWIRCDNWRNIGRRVCGMNPSLLEDLLAGTVLVVGGISIEAFARELQTLMGDAEAGIRGFIRETR